MKNWELILGLYPGILIGFREYDQSDYTDYVLYMPLVELCLTIYKD